MRRRNRRLQPKATAPQSVGGAGMAVHIGSDHTVINWIDELVGPIRIGNAVNPGARIERSGTGGQSAIDGP